MIALLTAFVVGVLVGILACCAWAWVAMQPHDD